MKVASGTQSKGSLFTDRMMRAQKQFVVHSNRDVLKSKIVSASNGLANSKQRKLMMLINDNHQTIGPETNREDKLSQDNITGLGCLSFDNRVQSEDAMSSVYCGGQGEPDARPAAPFACLGEQPVISHKQQREMIN